MQIFFSGKVCFCKFLQASYVHEKKFCLESTETTQYMCQLLNLSKDVPIFSHIYIQLIYRDLPPALLKLRPKVLYKCDYYYYYYYYYKKRWWRGTVVERRSLAGELSLSCARPAADG